MDYILVHIAAIIVSTTVHEWGHAKAALYYGDWSVRSQVTFDPRVNVNCWLIATVEFARHIGIDVPMVAYGQIHYRPENLRNRWSRIWVALAGPLAELCLWALCTVILSNVYPTFISAVGAILSARLTRTIAWFVKNFAIVLAEHSLRSAFFNALPLPSLDGFAVLGEFWPELATQLDSIPAQQIWVPLIGTHILDNYLLTV